MPIPLICNPRKRWITCAINARLMQRTGSLLPQSCGAVVVQRKRKNLQNNNFWQTGFRNISLKRLTCDPLLSLTGFFCEHRFTDILQAMVTLAQILRNYLGNRQTCHCFGRTSSDFVIEGPNSRIAPRVALGSPAICMDFRHHENIDKTRRYLLCI